MFWPRVRFEIRTRLDRHPSIFPWQIRLRGLGRLLVSRETDLVVEGYPRSGNTWVVAALDVASQGRLRIASHLHALGQIRLATRWGIPTLVLVRRLPDPVLSLVVRESWMTMEQALRFYVEFHEGLIPLARQVVVVPFEQAIPDFGAVLRRVEARFGVQLPPWSGVPEERDRVRQRVEEMERADSGGAVVREHAVARPSAAREEWKAAMRGRYDDPHLDGLRRRGERVVDELLREGVGA